MALALRPSYRLRLGLERLQDAIAFLLDDKILDWATFRTAFRAASMKTSS
jgi:hypothetical protein